MTFLSDFFKIKDSYKSAIVSLLISMFIGMMAYNLYIIYGYTHPDGIVEGLTSYINAGWHIGGCGRYGIPIVLMLSANVHNPFVTVVFFVILSWLTGFVCVKLWKVNRTFPIVCMTSVMCVTITTIDHITTNTVALPYALSGFLASLFVYLMFTYSNKWIYLFASCCLGASISIYQAYLGLAAVLCLMTLIIKILEGDENIIITKAIQCVIFAGLGCVLYAVGLKIVLAVTGIELSSRMADLSLWAIIFEIIPQLSKIYSSYFNYFYDTKMHKEIVFALIGLVFVVSLAIRINNLSLKNKLFVLIGIILIPLASNVEAIATPHVGVSTNMQYQAILIVPFTIYLANSLEKKVFINTLCVFSLIVTWMYIVCANATFRCYQLSYQTINYQMSLIMDDVIHYDDYNLNESKVLFIGYPEDNVIKNNIRTYKYAYDFDFYPSVVFWDNQVIGYTYNRKNYMMDYFGIDIKDILFSEYLDVINSDDYKNMTIWPKQGSIKEVNGIIVVKLTDNPYLGD